MEHNIATREAIVEKLEHYIWENHLTSNMKLPSERTLCNLWNVNRTTLRFAISILVDRGILKQQYCSGTYIAEPKQVRNLTGVNRMTQDIKQAGIHILTKILSLRTTIATKYIAKQLHMLLGEEVYECIRLRKLNNIPSIIETTYINKKTFPDFDKYYNGTNSMNSLFKNFYKKEIYEGSESISVTYCSKEEANLLDIDEGTACFFVTGVTTTKDKVPVEYYKAIFRADCFKFVSLIDKS